LGIRLWKWGMPDNMKLHYLDAKILDVAKINEKNYSFSLSVSFEDVCIATFDFENKLFDAFMNQVPESKKEIVYNALTRQPFKYLTEKECPTEQSSIGHKNIYVLFCMSVFHLLNCNRFVQVDYFF
jgi:hypothetical protein